MSTAPRLCQNAADASQFPLRHCDTAPYRADVGTVSLPGGVAMFLYHCANCANCATTEQRHSREGRDGHAGGARGEPGGARALTAPACRARNTEF